MDSLNFFMLEVAFEASVVLRLILWTDTQQYDFLWLTVNQQYQSYQDQCRNSIIICDIYKPFHDIYNSLISWIFKWEMRVVATEEK